MTDNDSALFLAEMADVTPLQQNHVMQSTRNTVDPKIQLQRRVAAQASAYLDTLVMDSALFPVIAPDELVSYKREGVQQQVFKRLRQGKYSYDTGFDLRGRKLREVRRLLIDTILGACCREERCILLIHGTGKTSQPYPGVIKSAVCFWLSQMAEVMAYHTASRDDGGYGAVYVMLEKSDRQKSIAKETLRKGAMRR
ncbi:DNA mismatch repair protein MutS [Shewanella sp. NFH-SH190041]|uniref:DNA endonuclease SmrA n=1 Tax=Shewanella sp. NFH-SH190041 TaxID=2950245 RepID=UPI0021C4B92B|nr:DNA endonuclease SmrA [Shewanella sp. NFH-SH190041]BDM64025.1 DNA mismatch repair protein MutS [Shewanella sp. NFH-SH190041]